MNTNKKNQRIFEDVKTLKIAAFGTLGILGIVAGVLIGRPEPLSYIGLVMGVCFVIGVCVAIVNLIKDK